MATTTQAKPKNLRELKGELERAEVELGIQVARYQTRIFEDIAPSGPITRDGEPGWNMVSSGGQFVDDEKFLSTSSLHDRSQVRKSSYRMWRLDPHGHAILRNFQKFVIGRDFKIDYEDEQYGHWSDRTKTKLVIGDKETDKLVTFLVVDEFMKRSRGVQRFKETVLRTARDGEVFIRKFKVGKGRIDLRFIEPSRVGNPRTENVMSVEDPWRPGERARVVVEEGIEHLVDDVESVTAYHLQNADGTTTRIPADEVIHHKAGADMNDLRGFPILEPVLKKIANYEKWEEARVVLNQVRTSVALVRKVTGTQSQAAALIQGRNTGRATQGFQTESGRTEAALRPGTVITAPPGVDYDFKSPNLEARDAGEDGRRFLLSVAAGVGMPEMLVTGDWSNSNYASSVEARTPAVREWEDWQDSFEPVFERIILWVLEAAIDDGILPEDTSLDFTIHWPTLITKDEPKQTLRNATLNAAGLLSRTTWAAQEGLNYDDELTRIAREEIALPDPMVGNPTNSKRGVTLATGVMGKKQDTTSPDLREQRAAALRTALVGLNELQQEGVSSEKIQEALGHYVDAAKMLVESEEATKGPKVPEPIAMDAILGAFTQAMQAMMEVVKHPPAQKVVRTRVIERDPVTHLASKVRDVEEPVEVGV